MVPELDRTGNYKGGGWIETFSGRYFPVADPSPSDISIVDIAHALSLVCRYGGHCREFYSVAQHSVHVSDVVSWLDDPSCGELRLAALLHDASEAYIADICRPVKPLLNGYAELEARIQDAVWKRFGLSPTKNDLAAIKTADNSVLRAEAEKLIKSKAVEWPWNGTVAAAINVVPIGPWDAEELFIRKFEFLSGEKVDERWGPAVHQVGAGDFGTSRAQAA